MNGKDGPPFIGILGAFHSNWLKCGTGKAA